MAPSEYRHTEDLLTDAHDRLEGLVGVYRSRGEGVRAEKAAVVLRHLERAIAAYDRMVE